MVSAAGSGALMSSTDYGQNWLTLTTPINVTWTAVCGTSQGNKLFAFGTDSTLATPQIVLYTSTIIDNQSVSWTKSTSPAFFADIIRVNRVRCSGDGIYIVATDNTLIDDGRFLYSSDGGSTWTRRPLDATLPVGRTFGVTMSRSGAIQYLTFQIAAGSSSSIWRSFDYGATFSLISNQVTDDLALNIQWYYLECDATGRFLYATRYNSSSTYPRPYRSADYGATFTSGGSSALAGLINVWISATGQFVVGIQNPYESTAPVAYSNDYGRTFSYYGLGNVLYSSIAGSADGSILVLGAAPVSSGDGKLRIARLGQQNIQDLSVTGGTITKSGGIYNLLYFNTWDNDITLTLSNAFYANPTLTNPLDINNYVHEVHIDMVLSGNPSSWMNMGFNEYFTTSASDANHYAINWGVFDADGAPGTFGGYNHNPYVNFVYCDVSGNISIRMFVEANRQLGQGRLGVVARGSWDLVGRGLTDQGSIINTQKQFFTKYQYGAPLMTSAYPNGTLYDINYISIGTNNTGVIQRFRIKTKKHALSSD
jgi:hypothetical protein